MYFCYQSIFLIIVLFGQYNAMSKLFHRSLSKVKVPPPSIIKQADFINSKIDCIFCDMDGTLLNSKHYVEGSTLNAIKRVMAKGIKFVPATGRTRYSMAQVCGADYVNSLSSGNGGIQSIPGVYCQGCTVYDSKGKLIYEAFLDNAAIRVAESFCERNEISLIAYKQDEIITCKQTEETQSIVKTCREIEPIASNMSLFEVNHAKPCINKLIVLGKESKLAYLRPQLEKLVANKATITKAMDGMLEVLPLHVTKGDGVKIFLKHEKIDAGNCIAIGDGENDKEMIRAVKYGIAMGNAKALIKDISLAHTLSNDDEGVKHTIELLLNSLE